MADSGVLGMVVLFFGFVLHPAAEMSTTIDVTISNKLTFFISAPKNGRIIAELFSLSQSLVIQIDSTILGPYSALLK